MNEWTHVDEVSWKRYNLDSHSFNSIAGMSTVLTLLWCFSWYVKGGHVTGACGDIHEGIYLSMDGHLKPRMLCSPYTDMTQVGGVRFHFAAGNNTSIAFMQQSMWITRVPHAQADPGDSDLWIFLLSKSPPGFALFVSESPQFPTPGGGNLCQMSELPLVWIPLSKNPVWDVRKWSESPVLPVGPYPGDSHWLVHYRQTNSSTANHSSGKIVFFVSHENEYN